MEPKENDEKPVSFVLTMLRFTNICVFCQSKSEDIPKIIEDTNKKSIKEVVELESQVKTQKTTKTVSILHVFLRFYTKIVLRRKLYLLLRLNIEISHAQNEKETGV